MNDVSALLGSDEPAAFTIENADARSPFVLVTDHASARIPRKLHSLGLSSADLQTHIAWDIGAAAVARHLASHLDAWLILQNYSRLVIDCNRPPGSTESIVTQSERTEISGNASIAMDHDQRAARTREVFEPYHAQIRAALDDRAAAGRPTVLIAMHSFTPRYMDDQRPWHTGLLYNRDGRLAQPLLSALRSLPGLVVGDKEPYSMDDETDYTLPVHGEGRGLMHVGIEVRQDLIADETGQRLWARRLADALLLSIRLVH